MQRLSSLGSVSCIFQIGLVSVSILLVWPTSIQAAPLNDFALSGYYLGKATLPLLALPVAIEDGDQVLFLTMGLIGVMTVPASGVLYQRWLGDSENIIVWRKICAGTDLALASGGVIYGLMTMFQKDPHSHEQFISVQTVGVLAILGSGLYGLNALVDLKPFSNEGHQTSNLTVAPLLAFNTKAAGLVFLYRY
jgi:hypothetical protein